MTIHYLLSDSDLDSSDSNLAVTSTVYFSRRNRFLSGSNHEFLQFITFLDRLSKAMQMDEISQEIGLDLQTESLLVRAEQLARLETDKLVDKVKGTIYITYFPMPLSRC